MCADSQFSLPSCPVSSFLPLQQVHKLQYYNSCRCYNFSWNKVNRHTNTEAMSSITTSTESDFVCLQPVVTTGLSPQPLPSPPGPPPPPGDPRGDLKELGTIGRGATCTVRLCQYVLRKDFLVAVKKMSIWEQVRPEQLMSEVSSFPSSRVPGIV